MNINIEQNDIQNNIDEINQSNQRVFKQQIDINQNININENDENNKIDNEKKINNENLNKFI